MNEGTSASEAKTRLQAGQASEASTEEIYRLSINQGKKIETLSDKVDDLIGVVKDLAINSEMVERERMITDRLLAVVIPAPAAAVNNGIPAGTTPLSPFGKTGADAKHRT